MKLFDFLPFVAADTHIILLKFYSSDNLGGGFRDVLIKRKHLEIFYVCKICVVDNKLYIYVTDNILLAK